MKQPRSIAIIIVNRDRPDLTDNVVRQIREMKSSENAKLYVIECGSNRKGRSRYATHFLFDPFYRGRYYGFERGLKIARKERDYPFYWFVVNDVVFPKKEDVLGGLTAAMEEDPTMAIISPGEPDANDYRGCHPKPGRRWHKASTVHGLAFLMRGEAIGDVGFCNPRFRYSQGAGTELAYKLYSRGWFLAYSDTVTMKHLGGSIYGKVVSISRHEYLRRSRNFASRYLRKLYGKDWDNLFSSVLPADVEVNTFPWQKSVWEKRLKREPYRIVTLFRTLGSRLKQFLMGMNDGPVGT